MNNTTTYSQSGQDIYLRTLFPDQYQGFFVDIGAYDGIALSNSYWFELKGWSGICVEPIREIYDKLSDNRKCRCLYGAVTDQTGETVDFLHVKNVKMLSGIIGDYDPRHIQRIKSECGDFDQNTVIEKVPALRFNDFVDRIKVDILCIDTEGNELKILKDINWNKYDISVVVAENNYGDSELDKFMKSMGYHFLKRLDGDCVYRKN